MAPKNSSSFPFLVCTYLMLAMVPRHRVWEPDHVAHAQTMTKRSSKRVWGAIHLLPLGQAWRQGYKRNSQAMLAVAALALIMADKLPTMRAVMNRSSHVAVMLTRRSNAIAALAIRSMSAEPALTIRSSNCCGDVIAAQQQ